jgi:dTDP-4-amino-4,6-dideoxygalactose transaminase
MTWKIPFFDLVIEDEEKNAVLEVLNSNWLTAGPQIQDFEKKFSSKLGEETEAVAVSSATAALHLSLIALNIKPDDEVIVPSLTFVACANAIRYIRAIPVFADICSEDNWNISVADTEKKITSKTRAIMIVHYAGYPCDMNGFVSLAKKYDLKLIEDCSHAPLIKYKGKSIGTLGDVGCFSFFSNKNMTTGEGGMIVSRNPKVIERLRTLRSHGITASTYQRFKGHAYGYDVAELGFNYRLDEIRAAIGIQQLRKLPLYNKLRKQKVTLYRELLMKHLPEVTAPFANHEGDSSYHIFPVLIPGVGEHRNLILKAMGKYGIQCSMHYQPIHTFSAYEDFSADVPITDRIAGSILTLPLYPTMSDEQITDVVETLSQCQKLN